MQISPEDIRWDGDDLAVSHRSGPGQGLKKSSARSGAVLGPIRGRGSTKSQSKKELLPLQNGAQKKLPDDIELFNTDTLVKEVRGCTAKFLNVLLVLVFYIPGNMMPGGEGFRCKPS